MSNDLTEIIRQPGKFEGEPAYVRDVLWPLVLDGGADVELSEDDGDSPVSVFFLDAPMRREYELADTDHAILVWERSDGFVCSSVVNLHRYNRIVRAYGQED